MKKQENQISKIKNKKQENKLENKNSKTRNWITRRKKGGNRKKGNVNQTKNIKID